MAFPYRRTVARLRSRKPKTVPLSLFLLERVLNQVVKLGVLSYLLAWLLARTSTHAAVNLPVAIAVVLALRWVSLRLVVHTRETRSKRSRRSERYGATPVYYTGPKKSSESQDRDGWKRIVNAPIVETAWESFSGSIIQEWIYDSWYSLVTPDREFPAEIRKLLNDAFAEICQRARRVDLRTVLVRDICDLLTEQLELYRNTKEGVGILNEGDLRPASRDRAFQQEMKTEGKLHPAFCTRDGHYRVIKSISEGIVSLALPKEDVARPYAKSLVRELLATCVLRPILMFFTPHNANKLLLSAFPKENKKLQGGGEGANGQLDRTNRKEMMNGHQQFEQRIRRSAALEERAVKKAKERLTKLTQQTAPPDVYSIDDSAMDKYDEGQEAGDRQARLKKTRSKSMDDLCEMVLSDPSVREGDVSDGGSVMTEPPSVKSEPVMGRQRADRSNVGVLTGWRSNASELSSEGLPVSRGATGPVRSPFSNQNPMAPPPRNVRTCTSEEVQRFGNFVGWPRARVVAFELKDEGSKSYVAFQIRVADNAGEWTVARRYRNFESLHKALRDLPVYRMMDLKLPSKGLLLNSRTTEFVEHRRVALDKYLQKLLSHEALACNPDVWGFLCDQYNKKYNPDLETTLLRTITDNVDTARHTVKRAVGNAIDEGRRRYLQTDSHPSTPVATPTSTSSQLTNPQLMNHTPTRWQSVPDQTHSGYITPTSTPPNARRTYASVRMASSDMSTMGSVHGLDQSPSVPIQGDLLERTPPNINLSGRYANLKKEESRSGILSDGKSVDESTDTPIKVAPSGSGSQNMSGLHDIFGMGQSLPHSCLSEDEESWPDWEAEFEDYSGISGPLYHVVDAVFDLPAQKFFRRQILQVVRQLLSLLAGDAIDVYLVEKIKSLRTEHTIARIVHLIQNSLWPGGEWFASRKPYCTLKENAIKASGRKPGMQRDRYIEPLLRPSDEEEVAKKLRGKLFRQTPNALVRLMGRTCYTRGIADVYEMLQLPTFVTQIGYGAMEIILLALFPEMKEMFSRMHKETAYLRDS